MSEPTGRRWLRFNLRTLLVGLTLLCCWLGWETSIVRSRRALLREIAGNAAFRVVLARDWARYFPAGSPAAEPTRVFILRQWLGDEAVQSIEYSPHYPGYSERLRQRLARSFPEADMHEGPLYEPCHPGCFPRGTLVETPTGPRPIEQIRPGDLLIVVRPGGEKAERPVQSVFTTTNRLWEIRTSEGTLLTTEAQPLCPTLDEAQTAGKLLPGDTILAYRAGEVVPVAVLSVGSTGETAAVFNLVIGDSELFVAGGFLARSKPPAR
ncbi:MAG: Hint domain-containing protein [Pirellulaceae bacterium]|nr:Hint domain-containing protein [Pirellulaceae bacterium]